MKESKGIFTTLSTNEFDHPESSDGSSGIYINTCLECNNQFMGYKGHRYCVKHESKNWHKITLSPPKGESKTLTEADYHKYLAMRDEFIFEQKEEISKLKMKINNLQNKIDANHNN